MIRFAGTGLGLWSISSYGERCSSEYSNLPFDTLSGPSVPRFGSWRDIQDQSGWLMKGHNGRWRYVPRSLRFPERGHLNSSGSVPSITCLACLIADAASLL